MQYTSTRVGSVIFYQCWQSGFDPSSLSAVCMEDGRWSPDPSQVVCRMIPVPMSMLISTPTLIPTGTKIAVALQIWEVEYSLLVFRFCVK